MKLSQIRQAGAIAVRNADHKVQILVVRAKRNPDNWIFPKGHIESKESAEEAAVRELEEEGGVSGKVIAAVGVQEFDSKDDVVHVEYFLIKYKRDVERDEDRETKWCSYARALELLTYPDTKNMLKDARGRIEKAIGKVGD
jgi:8-oxo-dGTP pyrophosphatase MutT (NUDIX family)